MKEFWNKIYRQEERIYGSEPNVFFKQELDKLQPGKLLLPGEGEGRNAVYAAQKGWTVTAFDYSEAGKEKAMKLAQIKNVNINYSISSFNDFPIQENSFDVIALTFIHTPNRAENHRKLIPSLKKGGFILIEAFSKNQMNYNSGGPQKVEMLFSPDDLKKDFADLDIKYIKEEEIELNEGPKHKGKASVIRLIAKK